MKNIKVFLAVFCSFFIQYSFAKGGGNHTSVKLNTIEKHDSVMLVIKDKVGGELGFEDEFDDQMNILKGQMFIQHPTFIFDNYYNHYTTYLVKTKKNLEMIFDKKDQFWYVKSGDDKLDKELNFDVVFRKNFYPIKNVQDFIKYTLFEKPEYVKNYQLRKNAIDTYYAKKLSFLEKYQQENDLSLMFKSDWQTIIKYEKIRTELLINYAIQKWPKSYYEPLLEKNLKELKNDSLLFLPDFRKSLRQSVTILEFSKYHVISNSLNRKLEIIRENFSGKIKEYLLFSLLKQTKSGENVIKYNKDELEIAYNNFMDDAKSKNYKDYLTKLFSISKIKIENNEVLNTSKKSIKLSEIVKDSLTYLDFWASWCAPCRAEMPFSKKLKEEYGKKGVKFIYISLDNNVVAWEKAMHQIGLTSNESYILSNGANSPIAKQFKIQSIPRYILIGKNGKILNVNAPRPTNPKLKKVFDELLGKQK
jgi:thiol-disulfide isomerase/thioredoxin